MLDEISATLKQVVSSIVHCRMSGPDDERQLRAMAAKARKLATATTDTITIDVLTNYAEECEEQAERLRAARTLAPN